MPRSLLEQGLAQCVAGVSSTPVPPCA
jgi:hypothetical protein